MNNKPVLPRLQQQICRRAKLLLSSGVLVSSIILLLAATGPTSAYAAGSVILEDISYVSLPGNKVQITLTASGPLDEPTGFTTDNPARIALDFMGMKSGLERKTTPISIGMVRSITAVEAGTRTRVVVNLVDSVAYTVNIEGNRAIINIENGMIPAASSLIGKAASGVVHKAVSGRAIENIDFRRGLAGEGRIMITLSDPATLVDMREEGGRIVLDFFDTSLPEELMRDYDVTDFATPVQGIEASPSDGNVHIEILPTGNYEYLAYQTDRLYTIEVRPLTKEEKEKLEKVKRIFTGDRLSFNFQEIEVRSVLQLLADFTGLNMVTSDTVSGNVTLRLKNVPWDQALDIILKTKGLSMRQTDNVILVAPTEEMAAREKLELESERQVEELAPLRSEFIQINYAKAADLAALLKTEGNNLLSERGSITTDVRTNTLLIQDTAKKLEDVNRLIQTLDIPVRQVLIESRIVIANDDFAKDIGVRFGFNRATRLDGNELLIGGGQPGHLASLAADSGPWLNYGDASIEIPAGSGNEALMVNLPASAPSGAVNFLLGKLGSYLLQLELSAMQTEGRGEIVSSPRVITSDQKKASIKQGVEIPYQEASSSGATTVSFKEAVLQLDVTPHITPDDRIIMDLTVNKDSPDFSREVRGVPPVDTRSVQTTVLVENGETVVLGGVFERAKTYSKERVPFFGDLPYVGFMFKQEAEQDTNNELLIFVTPKILRDSMSLR
ncbi:Type IV pilus biogenesis protein PilQ [hydrothermal vent metagenome]|uniref:Type IV pilus biogenesis protein PilQ n=1 Tax=hydrothermal vent metagenome TaxID=652676 RepID=A0A3B1B814_9ZZZZ